MEQRGPTASMEAIRFDIQDGLATIVLARPDKRNAMNARMFEELGEVVELAAADPAIRGVVVRGDGPSFCAGLDLEVLGELSAMATGSEDFLAFVRWAQRGFRALALMPKPSIAAVQGHAVGAGCQLALACDIRLAATDARFGILEGRYGLIPDLGGPYRLAHAVGPAAAKELIWTARTLDANEALSAGVVQSVVDPSELPAAAEALAREVIRHSPIAVAEAKRLVDEAATLSFDDHLARAADAQERCIRSDDHREAVVAYLEGRAPQYRGT